jgi:hypothetical protein
MTPNQLFSTLLFSMRFETCPKPALKKMGDRFSGFSNLEGRGALPKMSHGMARHTKRVSQIMFLFYQKFGGF